MPDALAVLGRWWKQIAAITVAATVVAIVAVLLIPSKYVSIATALPASSFAADKSAIFNSNIQQLYSSLGTADDLDRIIGTARLDTIYIATVAKLNLAAHYGIKKALNNERKAAQKLKQQSNISKSEWGELKIKVWDRNRNVAAQAANTLVEQLQALHQNLQNRHNQIVLRKLKETYAALQRPDTNTLNDTLISKMAQEAQLNRYEKLLAEYSLTADTNPPVLLVVEAARPAMQPDNAAKLSYVLLASFGAFVFAVLLAFYTEGKNVS